MESLSFMQTLHKKNWRFEDATTLEDVLCLSTMVMTGDLCTAADVNEARSKWLELYEGDCYKCPWNKGCIACIMNE